MFPRQLSLVVFCQSCVFSNGRDSLARSSDLLEISGIEVVLLVSIHFFNHLLLASMGEVEHFRVGFQQATASFEGELYELGIIALILSSEHAPK